MCGEDKVENGTYGGANANTDENETGFSKGEVVLLDEYDGERLKYCEIHFIKDALGCSRLARHTQT